MHINQGLNHRLYQNMDVDSGSRKLNQCGGAWNLYSLKRPAEGDATSCKNNYFSIEVWENDFTPHLIYNVS